MSTHARRSPWSFASPLLALPLFAAALSAQPAIISGRVTTEQGNPLEVATVFITEMNLAGMTDAQGRYTITIPAARVTGQSVILQIGRAHV